MRNVVGSHYIYVRVCARACVHACVCVLVMPIKIDLKTTCKHVMHSNSKRTRKMDKGYFKRAVISNDYFERALISKIPTKVLGFHNIQHAYSLSRIILK
jgi:hypothetical protein